MIAFNRPYLTGREFDYIREAVAAGQLAGNGQFTRRCQAWLQETLGARECCSTHSCTAALEMAALLLDLQPGDEVIMPSFTFVSTANAFVLRGATPVFVDIRADTLNIDETLIEAAITPRTRAIVAVHYAGVACDMDADRGDRPAPRPRRDRGRRAGTAARRTGAPARVARATWPPSASTRPRT